VPQFNVIYTPGSVRYLGWFALSLLKWSDPGISYRLVANGCSLEEEEILRKFCDGNPRFNFLRYPSAVAVKHAIILSYLQEMEKSDLFCVIDSDILATGDFLSDFRPFLGNAAAVCSCHAIWTTVRERVASSESRVLRGSHHHAGRWCVGSTFFAIYDNRFLRQIIAKYGVSFHRFRKWENIPPVVRQTLLAAGFGPKIYDTGKVLNILLQIEGGRVIHRDSDHLIHIGGISKRSSGNAHNQHDLAFHLGRGNLKAAGDVIMNWREWPLLARKANISRYFTEFLESLVDGTSFNTRLRVSEPEIRQEVLRALKEIRNFYSESRSGVFVSPVLLNA
jgi:hypothetical protein